jgi:hypothetical protein
MLLLGNGGADKSYTIYHILIAMKDKGERVLVMATTGKVATMIGGSTIPSNRGGFGISTGAAYYKERAGRVRPSCWGVKEPQPELHFLFVFLFLRLCLAGFYLTCFHPNAHSNAHPNPRSTGAGAGNRKRHKFLRTGRPCSKVLCQPPKLVKSVMDSFR